MLIVCEVLCSTEMELPNCGFDWYRVPCLSPLTKAIAIEAEYQKLLSLQPINNDFSGTSDGLKSGNEAAIKRDVARCCSDKPDSSRTKRTTYDACVGIGSVSPVAEDYADEKQKQICAEEASRVTAKMRKAELFSTGQDWVAYDQENMPCRYGWIDKVLADKSQLHVTWFRSCPQTLQEKRWCDAGFPVACGSFALELSKSRLVSL
ncbi:hypothetical protein COCNU_11G003520 [Cocos nucifera]|uniref:DUF3444 domain-containing protein n=1 Tax=Cocos nucifera TaxID=13894 RepID=A0A8K0IP25_COCNU|nr:hypothetical protein COCNU_11G003520 [Cocos nucifera]